MAARLTPSDTSSLEKEVVETIELKGGLLKIPSALDGAKVANVAMAAAVTGTRTSAFNRGSLKLYLCLMVAFMASVQNGFDGSVMSGINAMHQYLSYFGYAKKGLSTGIVFSVYQIGNICGALVAGFVTDKWGRRGGLIAYSVTILIGVAFISSAQNRIWFIMSRWVLGIGISIATTAAPVYVTELAPPQWRGRCVGALNACYFIGAVMINGIITGTGKMNSTLAWRLPLALQAIPALVVLCAVWFIPESPRWLMSRGRVEEARLIFAELHADGDQDAPIVLLQMEEIRESLAAMPRQKFWDFSALVKTHDARWRSGMVILMSLFGQWSGNGLGYFLPLLFEAAGIGSQQLQLILNFVNSIIQFFSAMVGAALTDAIGRRNRLIWGSFLISVTLAILCACTTLYGPTGPQAGNKTGANVGIVFIYLYGVIFAFCYTPLQSLYCSEVLHFEMRAKGMAAHTIVVNGAGFVNTFAIPIALAKIDSYTYLIYVGWTLIEAVVWYFFCVETRGRTLEELDEIFRSPNPVAASKQAIIVKIKSSEHNDEAYLESRDQKRR